MAGETVTVVVLTIAALMSSAAYSRTTRIEQTEQENLRSILCEGYRRKALPSLRPIPAVALADGPERAAYEPVISRPCIADCQMSVSQYWFSWRRNVSAGELPAGS
jgi:hypothetical protein